MAGPGSHSFARDARQRCNRWNAKQALAQPLLTLDALPPPELRLALLGNVLFQLQTLGVAFAVRRSLAVIRVKVDWRGAFLPQHIRHWLIWLALLHQSVGRLTELPM